MVPQGFLDTVVLTDCGSIKFVLQSIGTGLDYKYIYMSAVNSNEYTVYCSEYGYFHRRVGSTEAEKSEIKSVNEHLSEHVRQLNRLHWDSTFFDAYFG